VLLSLMGSFRTAISSFSRGFRSLERYRHAGRDHRQSRSRADLVLLDRDIFSVDPYTIGDTEVLATYLDGRRSNFEVKVVTSAEAKAPSPQRAARSLSPAQPTEPGDPGLCDGRVRFQSALALPTCRTLGEAIHHAIEDLSRPELAGTWVHLDADVLDDAVMPAVDYRMPGGLSWEEVAMILQVAIASGKAIGLNITIFNPKLDSDGSIAAAFVDTLVKGLRS
jgi:Arginase family